ncbi:MAG: FAD/NAD(P)-binding protein [Desulfurivibrio sp.]|nr:FAD/NAD(P)-binding protein [Desulfurivibrio sp.]
MKESRDPLLPISARVSEVIRENPRIMTVVLEPPASLPTHQPGQFFMVSLPHCGEAPLSIASAPREAGLRLSVLRVGRLTTAFQQLRVGQQLGLRGPYGRPFPLSALKGRDLFFIAGGIGLAPLRAVINSCLAAAGDFGRLTLLYGSRTPAEVAFTEDLRAWGYRGLEPPAKDRRAAGQQGASSAGRAGITCQLTVDQGASGWSGAVGLVTELLPEYLEPERTSALLCGPPPMIRAVIARLRALGLPDEQIITTLERHMKCGIGICRHCHLDDQLVCEDGPVFTVAELQRLAVPPMELP